MPLMSLAIGDRVGPYEVVALLGRGGMGEVWRARDPRPNRDVAREGLAAYLIRQLPVRTARLQPRVGSGLRI